MDQQEEVTASKDDVKDKKNVALKSGIVSKLLGFFQDAEAPKEPLVDVQNELAKHKSVVRLVTRQSYILAFLTLAMILLLPIIQPVHKYIAIRADKKTRPLFSLFSPNLTDRAILSWSATSITEVMTFGFGDINTRLIGQQSKFTGDGWISFVKAVFTETLIDRFKTQQLVLTTVPVGAPVIVAKGRNKVGAYQWFVEMPIIMTYATNNNKKTGRKSIVRLTIVRVPTHQNKAGLGIEKWKMM